MKRRSFLRGIFAAPLAPVAIQSLKFLPRPAVASSSLDLVAWSAVLKQHYTNQAILAATFNGNPWLKFLKTDSGIATPPVAVSLDP